MSVRFSPRACHRALSAYMQKVAPQPEIQVIMASAGIRRLVAKAIKVIGQDVPGDTLADAISIQVARQAWFSDVTVITSIAEAVTKSMKVPELLAPAQIFFASMHGQENSSANEELSQTGISAFVAAFVDAKTGDGKELDAREKVLYALEISNVMLIKRLCASYDLTPEAAAMICGGEMTIAGVLNEYPQVILLPMAMEQADETDISTDKCRKKAKKRCRRKPA